MNKRNIIINEKGKGETRTYADENGNYCFEVKSGTFNLQVHVSSDEKEKGLKFLPNERQVVVDN